MSSRNKTDVKKLFEYWCEVSRTHGIEHTSLRLNGHDANGGNSSSTPEGVITESFPENFREEKTIANIPAFAFPCEFESDAVQLYSFVLTTDDSKWRYGFCRHDPKAGNTMVIITFLPWHDTFLKLLSVLAELRRTDIKDFHQFLTETYNSGVPDVGSQLRLVYSQGQSQFIFERPKQFQLPSIPENHNLNLYYNFVYPKNMIAVFAAMLAERRIIFTSKRLDRLSSCIQAANAFLYPMVWQHIFIPMMPMKLKDYLSAPMPYLIGVPAMVLETMMPEELGDVVILNCDRNIFESPFDDVHSMPPEIVAHLKKELSRTNEHMGDRVSKIFLGVLVQLIGGYRDAVEFRDTGKTFNSDKFIDSRPSHLRPFLRKMMELQIFRQFIDERLEMMNTGLGFSDEFEQETVRYAEKRKKYGRFYQFKEKTNPAVKSAVKSVKESSQSAKHAYKNLKSKLRDITPPHTTTHSAATHFRSHLTSNSQHDRLDGGIVYGKDLTMKSYMGRHSAPSSPIFGKRVNGVASGSAVGFQYASKEQIASASLHMRRAPTPLAMSSSSSHIQSNGFAKSSSGSCTLNNNVTSSSPTVSPASSLCSSEMNLSQELQNHPLFKTPMVDRSSLRSLQPQHMTMGMNGINNIVVTSTATTTTTTAAVTNSRASEDSIKDLISLDDSHNSSFDLEDFDPLNQNARPLPTHIVGGTKNRNNINQKKSTTLPTNAKSPSALMTSSSISNPLYTYYTPQHFPSTALKPPTEKPPPLPKTVPPPMPPPDEDFELLRKYGLDQFTLITTAVTTTSNSSTVTTTGMSNWTTFD